MMVLDDGALAYRERNQLSTWEHIQQNAKAVVLFRDAEKDVGWKFRCTVNVYQDGERFDQVMERLAELGYNVDPATPGTAVILQVDQVLNLTGEVLQERVPNLRW
jgi:hypothetical protein